MPETTKGLFAAKRKQDKLRQQIEEIHNFVIKAGLHSLAETHRRNSTRDNTHVPPLQAALTKLDCPNDAVVQHAIDIATAELRLKACVFGPTFAARLCEWAGRLKWRSPPASGDISWPE